MTRDGDRPAAPPVLRLLRRPEAALFALAFCAYAYFYQAGGWNQNSRFDLTRAIVDHHGAAIDAYQRNTGDKARRRGHYYCDKAPGASWLAVPAYALVHATARAPDSPRALAAGAYAATVWAVGVPAAAGVVALYWLLAAFGTDRRVRAAAAVAYGFGTLAFPYATLFYGHQLTAALSIAGFAILVRERRRDAPPRPAALAAAGLILGFAVAVEYPTALTVAAVCVYAAALLRPRRRLIWLVAGLAVPALALVAYHWIVFGGPTRLPYDFSTQTHRHEGFFMGLGAPSGRALANILVLPYRGLLFSSPWLALAVPGAVRLWRRGARAEVGVSAAVIALFLWLNSSLVDWQGGWTLGARYLVGSIPFWAILAAGCAAPGAAGAAAPPRRPGLRIAAWVAAGAAALCSIFLMLAGTAVKPEVPVWIQRPFGRYLLPAFRRGHLAISTQTIDSAAAPRGGPHAAWNLGQLLGLHRLASLLPLALAAAACAAWLVWALRRERALDRQ